MVLAGEESALSLVVASSRRVWLLCTNTAKCAGYTRGIAQQPALSSPAAESDEESEPIERNNELE
jgi:hypothetical protein